MNQDKNREIPEFSALEAWYVSTINCDKLMSSAHMLVIAITISFYPLLCERK